MNNLELNIEDLRILCKENKIDWTLHAIKRLRQRNIKTSDVEQCILEGEIIEQYPYDKPFASCLMYAVVKLQNIHIVVSSDKEKIYIVTAYRPSTDKWENDFKTRKGQ